MAIPFEDDYRDIHYPFFLYKICSLGGRLAYDRFLGKHIYIIHFQNHYARAILDYQRSLQRSTVQNMKFSINGKLHFWCSEVRPSYIDDTQKQDSRGVLQRYSDYVQRTLCIRKTFSQILIFLTVTKFEKKSVT